MEMARVESPRYGPRARRGGVLLILALILLTGSRVSALGVVNGQGLLWKIDNGDGGVSYLFGTIHSEDPSVSTLPAVVEKAFMDSDQLVLEVVLDTSMMIYTSKAMLFTDGNRLSSVLGQQLFREAASAMEERGIPERLLDRMKPWAVATALAMPEMRTGMFLDYVLYTRAQEEGMPIHGLETVQEQVGIFEDMSVEDQVAMLEETLQQRDLMEGIFTDLLQAYRARDLARLVRINEELMASGNRKLAEDLRARLINERNYRMADRLSAYLGAGNVFVAVGALHLPGEEGILRLLDKRGYTVTAVY